MFKTALFFISLIILLAANLAAAQSWVPNDGVSNTYANPPTTTPNPGNPNYHDASVGATVIRYGSSMSPASFAQMKAAEEAAKKRAEEEKKKHCDKKTQALADAGAAKKTCDAKAETDYALRFDDCSSKSESFTVQVPELRYQQGGSLTGNLSLPLKAASLLGIEFESLISVSISGSVTYNPAQNCRVGSGLFEKAAKSTCDANHETVKAKFATCS